MEPEKILVFNTAFIGDVILTLPLVQTIRSQFPSSNITFVAIPLAAGVLQSHPAIDNVIQYDKRGNDRGLHGMFRLASQLRHHRFDLAIVPHRSIRSALVAWLARIPRRMGFSTSAGRFLLTDVVPYKKDRHEIHRNLDLLTPLRINSLPGELPSLYPSRADKSVVDDLLHSAGFKTSETIAAIAPGSVWNTKRWLKEGFIELGRMLTSEGVSVALVGGKSDEALCREIESALASRRVVNAAGRLSPLQSAELIHRCRVAISNDSAPMHMAVAMRTPVVAVFGPTVPEFGFAPGGPDDQIVQTHGLSCRPCSIHGGDECPIKTFVCMKNISAGTVFEKVQSILSRVVSETDKAPTRS